jgi:hypothetical protein
MALKLELSAEEVDKLRKKAEEKGVSVETMLLDALGIIEEPVRKRTVLGADE